MATNYNQCEFDDTIERRRTHKDAFMQAVKGIPGNHVIKAFGLYTPGVNWQRCSKHDMSSMYADSMMGKKTSMNSYDVDSVREMDLQQLRRRALARMSGDHRWFEVE